MKLQNARRVAQVRAPVVHRVPGHVVSSLSSYQDSEYHLTVRKWVDSSDQTVTLGVSDLTAPNTLSHAHIPTNANHTYLVAKRESR